MPKAAKRWELDFADFPPGSVTEYSTLVCLACTFDIFTAQLGLAPRTAYSEIKKYSPTIAELTAPKAARPFFDSEEKNPHCPYCNAAKRWHARLDTFRIEGGKSTDAARRKVIKALPQKDNQFQVIESKTDKRGIFFDWLDRLGHKLDIEPGSPSPGFLAAQRSWGGSGQPAWSGGHEAWLIETTRAYLTRLEPKTDWSDLFNGVRTVRRSRRLEEGWKKEGARLFLSPMIYSEVLIVQYLVSRSHVHGGRTLEGRLTLQELVSRLRYAGYLDAKGISRGDQFEVLDQLIETVAGGAGNIKIYYIVDRRGFLEKVKSVYARYAA